MINYLTISDSSEGFFTSSFNLPCNTFSSARAILWAAIQYEMQRCFNITSTFVKCKMSDDRYANLWSYQVLENMATQSHTASAFSNCSHSSIWCHGKTTYLVRMERVGIPHCDWLFYLIHQEWRYRLVVMFITGFTHCTICYYTTANFI